MALLFHHLALFVFDDLDFYYCVIILECNEYKVNFFNLQLYLFELTSFCIVLNPIQFKNINTNLKVSNME